MQAMRFETVLYNFSHNYIVITQATTVKNYLNILYKYLHDSDTFINMQINNICIYI